MSENLHFSPVVTQKASEAIFDQIRTMILSGGLRPGDKLPSERALMQQLERSRPTIREALRMLENAGLIRIIPGGGAVVANPSSASVRQPLEQLVAMREITNKELLEFRSLNEMALAAWAAERRTDEDLLALYGLTTPTECYSLKEMECEGLRSFAPEVFEGKCYLDSDIWSFGIALLEMMGITPYSWCKNNSLPTMSRHATLPFGDYAIESSELVDFLKKCLTDVDDRWRVDELLDVSVVGWRMTSSIPL